MGFGLHRRCPSGRQEGTDDHQGEANEDSPGQRLAQNHDAERERHGRGDEGDDGRSGRAGFGDQSEEDQEGRRRAQHTQDDHRPQRLGRDGHQWPGHPRQWGVDDRVDDQRHRDDGHGGSARQFRGDDDRAEGIANDRDAQGGDAEPIITADVDPHQRHHSDDTDAHSRATTPKTIPA